MRLLVAVSVHVICPDPSKAPILELDAIEMPAPELLELRGR